jgi:hypothetical protein
MEKVSMVDLVLSKEYVVTQSSIEEVVEEIRTGIDKHYESDRIKQKTISYRLIKESFEEAIEKELDVKKKNQLKKQLVDIKNKDFKAVIVGTLFNNPNSRKADNISQITGLYSVDFDNVDDIQDKLNNLNTDKHTLVSYISPSGKGIKMFVSYKKDYIDDIKKGVKFAKEQVFEYLKKYYYQNYSLEIDEQTKDINRCSFVCWDPNVKYNPSAVTFDIEPDLTKLKIKKKFIDTKQVRIDVVDRIYNILHSNNIELKEFLSKAFNNDGNNYNNWILFGWFLCSIYKEDDNVKSEFHKFSQLDVNDYNEDGCEKQILSLISSFDEESKNYKLYLYMLVKYAKDRLGLELSNDENKIIRVENNFIRDWFYENIKVKVDSITGMKSISFSFKDNIDDINWVDEQITDYILNSVYIITKSIFQGITKSDISAYLYNGNIGKTNTFLDYLESIRTDDDKYINELIDWLVISDPLPDVSMKHMYIKNWILGTFSNVFEEDRYKRFLVIKGAQDVGKTNFVRNILLKNFKNYMTQDFHFSSFSENKDDLMKLRKYPFIFDDELKASNNRSMETIKKISSQDSISYRDPYGTETNSHKVISSFIACTNEDEMFNDLTGGVRFLVLELTGLIMYDDYHHKFTNEYMDKVWGFMYNEFKKGERWNKGKYEINHKLHNLVAETNRIINLDEIYLRDCVKPDPNKLMSIPSILERMKELYPSHNFSGGYRNINISKILNKLGIMRKRNEKGFSYYCRISNIDDVETILMEDEEVKRFFPNGEEVVFKGFKESEDLTDVKNEEVSNLWLGKQQCNDLEENIKRKMKKGFDS